MGILKPLIWGLKFDMQKKYFTILKRREKSSKNDVPIQSLYLISTLKKHRFSQAAYSL